MAESYSRAGNSFASACVCEKQSLGENRCPTVHARRNSGDCYGPQEKYLNRGETFKSSAG
jgi:hypothetical protein